MKKTLSYLLAASTAYTFSLRKMEESGILKADDQEPRLTLVSNENQTNEMFRYIQETLGSESTTVYAAYLYDPISKYLFIARSIDCLRELEDRELQFQAVKHTFNVLHGNTYPNLEDAKNSLGVSIKDQNLLQFMTNHPYAPNHPDFTQFVMTRSASKLYLTDFDQTSGAVTSIKQWVENNGNSSEFTEVLNKSDFIFTQKGLNNRMWEKKFVSPSGIKVNSAVEGVKLTKTLIDGNEKTIDFQKALEKYLEKQISLVDNFSQSFIDLDNWVKEKERNPTSLYNKDVKLKGTQKEESLVNEFLEKKEKFCLIEEQQKLLKSSEILTIRYIIPETSGKCTIIGTAIDKHTLTTFHWVAELREEELDKLFES